MITQIRKRDGRIVPFEKSKIADAIYKAASAVGGRDRKTASSLADEVIKNIASLEKPNWVPTVEEVQDIVEKVLIESGHAKTAKAYILYRQRRAELREEKKRILEKEIIDEVDKNFDLNALRVLKARYLRKDENGKLIETPKYMFTRVAIHTALPGILYDERVFDAEGKKMPHKTEAFAFEHVSIGEYPLNKYHLEALKRMYNRFNACGQMKVSWSRLLEMIKNHEFHEYGKNIQDFYGIMVSKKFLPNTPALANFGNVLGMGSACFVLGIEDNMESIMDTLKYTAIIHKSGGGTGFNFSKLRPEGDYVSSTSGVASGPMSFMRLFDTMTEVVKQGGIRRGANMGILNSNHPDIEKFIKSKEGNKALKNFNISVLIMQDFWSYYEKNEPYPLVNPRTGEVMRTVNPRMLFDMIVFQAWESAEPGVIFYDTVNKYNPFLASLGPIVTTNPCVASDTLVSTERGLERIDSIQSENILVDKRTVGSGSLLQYGCEFTKPSQIIKTGEKDCFEIETKSGYEITATPDHKILTANGWKEVLEITENDHLLIQSGKGKFNSDTKIPFAVKNEIIGKNGRKYDLNLPLEWSRELGLLLGWLTGDGWLNSKYSQIGLVFAKEDEEARKIIQPLFERYCNREIKEIDYLNGCVQLRSASKFVVDFFRNMGIKDANEKREVPAALFTATEDAVTGFLEGLFSSDGTIASAAKSRNYIRLNSSSIKLLKQVQLLLLNAGIKSSIYDRSTKNKIFRYTNKKGEIVKYKTSGTNYELNVSKQNLSRLIQLISFVQSRNKCKAEKLQAFEFYKETFAEKVKSKEYVGKKEVWDITEPKTHSFIANGIVVHNCGEVLLYPDEPCNLGSINVWAFAKEDDSGNVYYDWDGLKETTILATKFLDNVIDVNNFPLKQIEEMSLKTRKIGLGVMGVGDLLFELGIPYNSEEGRKFMEKLMEFINYYSKLTSIEIAERRGVFPFYEKSFYPEGRLPIMGFEAKDDWHLGWTKISEGAKKSVRNGFTTVIAPTGSISMIAGCSSGVEPVYSLVFEKNVKVGSFYYIDPVFEKFMRREGVYDEELMAEINASRGSLQNIPYISRKLKDVFVTAMDITPEDHIRALASFQKWTDSSISKTINFPANATVEDMRQSYLLAYKLGCKDVTVFRDTSIQDQVLVAPKKKEPVDEKAKSAAIPSDTGSQSGKPTHCPSCAAELSKKDGCLTCPECGWGLCSA